MEKGIVIEDQNNIKIDNCEITSNDANGINIDDSNNATEKLVNKSKLFEVIDNIFENEFDLDDEHNYFLNLYIKKLKNRIEKL